MDARVALGVTSALQFLLLVIVVLLVYLCRRKLCCRKPANTNCHCAKSTERSENATSSTDTTPASVNVVSQRVRQEVTTTMTSEPEVRQSRDVASRPRALSTSHAMLCRRSLGETERSGRDLSEDYPSSNPRAWRSPGGNGGRRWELPPAVRNSVFLPEVTLAHSADFEGHRSQLHHQRTLPRSQRYPLGLVHGYWRSSELLSASPSRVQQQWVGGGPGWSTVWRSSPHLLSYAADASDYNQAAPPTFSPPPYHLVASQELPRARTYSDPQLISADLQLTSADFQLTSDDLRLTSTDPHLALGVSQSSGQLYRETHETPPPPYES